MIRVNGASPVRGTSGGTKANLHKGACAWAPPEDADANEDPIGKISPACRHARVSLQDFSCLEIISLLSFNQIVRLVNFFSFICCTFFNPTLSIVASH